MHTVLGKEISIGTNTNIAINFETQLRTPTLVFLVQLTLGWTTYLLFISDIVNFVWKNDQGGGRKHCYFLLFDEALLVDEGCWDRARSLI